jgi:NAD(P)-dependent dehydrogenase (short-subunit alcohol dehydrogenase family)
VVFDCSSLCGLAYIGSEAPFPWSYRRRFRDWKGRRHRLCARGADVAISYLPTEEADAKEVIALISKEGRNAVALPGDISNERFCAKLVKNAHRKLGGLDILACVAGKQHAVDKIADVTTKQLEETYRVNVFALFWICKAALPLMPPGGSIITTASIKATHPSPSLLDYAPTKAAILAFTRGLARQVAGEGIRVNCVAPGPVWTPLQTSGGQPDKKFRHSVQRRR